MLINSRPYRQAVETISQASKTCESIPEVNGAGKRTLDTFIASDETQKSGTYPSFNFSRKFPYLFIAEEEVGQSSKRRKRLLNEAQYLLHSHSPTDGEGIRRRIDEYRSLISQAIDRVYLDVQHYDFLMDQITLLEDKLVQLKIEPAPEKIQTSHTSETKNA